MDMVDLRYLSIAVETGSFSRAAQSLGIKPSTISRRITGLEDELGVTIFERGSFGIRLTAAGRDVLVAVRRTLDAFDTVIRAGKSNGAAKSGRPRLGVRMPPIGQPLQPLLATWRTRHPGVVLTLHELNENEIFAALAERTLDAALVTTHTLRRGANSIPVYRETLVAALPRGHSLASHESLTWTLLREQILRRDAGQRAVGPADVGSWAQELRRGRHAVRAGKGSADQARDLGTGAGLLQDPRGAGAQAYLRDGQGGGRRQPCRGPG